MRFFPPNHRYTEMEAGYFASRLFGPMTVDRPPCECGSTQRTVMHHPDYGRPWLVGFLCQRCHRREHRGSLPRSFRIYDLRNGESEFVA